MSTDSLLESWQAILKRIENAALRCGRSPSDIRLLAISKGQSVEKIRSIAMAGQQEFGENYLQEALEKAQNLADLQLTWHFVGQIQGNKTRPIAESFAWVHTVDRERIAVRLNDQRPLDAPALNICIQVMLEAEPGKAGVAPADVLPLARRIGELPRLRLRGLMCIPPHKESFDEQLALFARLADLARQLRSAGIAIDTLSMGMSDDLESAVAAGSTCVRIGTALFGSRLSV
jgi:PLP dependent protein